MACTFCTQSRAAPAFYGTRNLTPVSAGHAVRKQSRACNPRFLILGEQRLRLVEGLSQPPVSFRNSRRKQPVRTLQPGCSKARKQGSGAARNRAAEQGEMLSISVQEVSKQTFC